MQPSPLRNQLLGRPTRLELLLAGLCAAGGTAEVLVPLASREGRGNEPLAVAVIWIVAVSLLWSRRAPMVSVLALPMAWAPLAASSGTFVLFYGQMVPLQVATFMVARFGRGREPWVGAAVVATCLLAIDLFVPPLQQASEIVFHWVVTTLVWGAGMGLRSATARARASTQRAVAAEVGAAERAMLAVVEERTRIARELHDIVGHSVSSMIVQAGAAEQAVDDPAFVQQALANVRRTGNEALDEMRRLVAMLRTDDDAPLAPQPGLDALPALVEATGGADVRLRVEGEPRELPSGLDLAVYRIVQEALTNVRRHSGATGCVVTLGYRPDAVEVSVVDDGHGGEVPTDGPGHGLVGMRERAVLYGGQLVAGPEPGGGFAVRAVLPVSS
ncbi:sensor histidine kinase [Knoellia locipacati]|uniref:sensor histidine kinase n=1 Tax=Knoellia locipacati TaxID=882824 RepID=UPI003850D6F8